VPENRPNGTPQTALVKKLNSSMFSENADKFWSLISASIPMVLMFITFPSSLVYSQWQTAYLVKISYVVKANKKMSYRRETARRFVSLNILLGHLRSLKVIRNDWWVGRIHWKLCLYLVPFLRYSASKNGVTLKLVVVVFRGNWKWRRSIDHIRLSIGPPL